MRMIARRATKVPSRSLSTRSATTQAPHCAETRPGRLPRHGQRSLGCGSGSMSAPFCNVSCGSLRPFPLHAHASPSPGRFSGNLLCRSACEGGQPFAAPRFACVLADRRASERAQGSERNAASGSHCRGSACGGATPKSQRRALEGLNQKSHK